MDKNLVSVNYARYKLSLHNVNTYEPQKSLQISLLTDSLQKLAVTGALMANHKTIKNETEYNYNFWEHKIPETDFDYLICVCLENQEGKIIDNGLFIIPKSVLKNSNLKTTINFFESDISGNYSREPKFNKNHFFNNFKILLE